MANIQNENIKHFCAYDNLIHMELKTFIAISSMYVYAL